MTQSIERVFSGRTRDLGGFEVRRVLPFAKQRMVGPFIFFDQMGPARFEPGQGVDVRPHPHIGLATVTYLFEGALHHKDSLGIDQVIRPGDVNWMIAGRAVVHSERTPEAEREAGHSLFGIQTWVALPEADEAIEAAFSHHSRDDLPAFTRDGVHYRLILGTAWGHEAPVEVKSPIVYLHVEMPEGAQTRLDIDHAARAVYLVEGAVTLDGQALEPGQMAVLTPGAAPMLNAAKGSTLMLCGGAEIGPRFIEWNFVASDPAAIEAAKADWTAAGAAGFPAGGRFTLPEGESEHIALPDPPPGAAGKTGVVKPTPAQPTS